MLDYVFFDNQFVPLSEAKVSIMTHALHYGTACFDGIRGNRNSQEKQIYLFRVKEHYQRLKRSCHIMKINLPYTIEELCQLTVKLVEMNECQEDIYIRPMAYKSSQVIGVRLHDLEDAFFIFVSPFGPYINIEGIKCGVSSWRRVDDTMMPLQAKVAGIYVNSALAKTEAWENGFDEAIMLSQDGHVAEGSGENIFIMLNGKLITPLPSDNILPGITRDTVIRLAKEELAIETVERPISRSELYLAEECFLCGTAAHITPVIEIDHRKVAEGNMGPVTAKLQQIYFEVIQGNKAKYFEWCTPVYAKAAEEVV
jgi:branched-chain amino acid aminotransferase